MITHEQRLKRIRRIHAMLANIIPYAWGDDPKVERDELRGLCAALKGIEQALGFKLEKVSQGAKIEIAGRATGDSKAIGAQPESCREPPVM